MEELPIESGSLYLSATAVEHMDGRLEQRIPLHAISSVEIDSRRRGWIAQLAIVSAVLSGAGFWAAAEGLSPFGAENARNIATALGALAVALFVAYITWLRTALRIASPTCAITVEPETFEGAQRFRTAVLQESDRVRHPSPSRE